MQRLRAILVVSWLAVLISGLAQADGARLEGELTFVRVTDGFWQVWIRSIESGKEIQVTTSPSDKRYPEWDGERGLYFRNNNDELFHWELSSRTVRGRSLRRWGS